MNYQEFFTTNNQSGWKCREDRLKNNHYDIWSDINDFINNNPVLLDLPYKEKVWCFINKQTTKPICRECTNLVKFKKSISEGYQPYCSPKCSQISEAKYELARKTTLERYGVEHATQSQKIQEKIKETMLERYGVDNIFKDVDYIQTKMIEKYGVKSPLQVPEIKEKWMNNNLEKYGYTTNLQCEEIRGKSNIKRKEMFLEKYSHLKFIKIDGDELTIHCDNCNNDYDISRSLLHYRHDDKLIYCTNCNPINSHISQAEKRIQDHITEVLPNENIINNDRAILGGKELDIYIPSKKLAIEFNGLIWHSDKYVEDDYHINKSQRCLEQSIFLIHIFEDETMKKMDNVLSIINHRLGITPNRIYARKTIVKRIQVTEARDFINKNGIAGYDHSGIRIGLFYNDELISVMTFNQNENNLDYTMNQFVCKLNYHVVGGFSKLLSFFKEKYEYKNIFSYSDIRMFSGDVFKVNGFILNKIFEPDYLYFGGRKRLSKVEIEVDGEVSTNEYKIYDCGKKEWLLTK